MTKQAKPKGHAETNSSDSSTASPSSKSPVEMPLAPVAKGIIILSSLVVAAGIALYENPQIREWVLNGRRKIAIALADLAEEINPSQSEMAGSLRSPQAQTSGESNNSGRMDSRSTGAEIKHDSIFSRHQRQEKLLVNSFENSTLTYNLSALAPSTQTASKPSVEHDSVQTVEHNDNSLSPPSFQSTPKGDLDTTTTAYMSRVQRINTDSIPSANAIDEEVVTTPVLTSSQEVFGVTMNHSLPQSPRIERDIDFVSDAGYESTTNIEHDDVSEIGGWSEVGSVSGDEDMLLGINSRHF